MTDEECATVGFPPITSRTPKGPALLFVHDQGVYLMSNGEPRLLTEDGKSNHVVYAKGCDPSIGEFDNWYGMSRELVGGDDFVEILPISNDWVKECDLCETFEIHVTGNAISYKFSDVKPLTPVGIKAIVTQEYRDWILSKHVHWLGLGTRAQKALFSLGATSVAGITELSAADLMECRGFGLTSLTQIREALARHDLTLKGETLATQRNVVSQ
ncbi:DUF3085 domain-containing protein [Sphingorhabdus sp.]|uniref:DUF3085 domain-containing protein n=1 Tax=Sphingorhabdus sp. TaxID=1902408 RepID=UPI0033424C8D